MKYVQSEAFEEWLRSYKCSGYYDDLERAESEAFRYLEVQKLSKRLCQNNRRRATAKFRVKIFSLLFIALSVRMFNLHLQSSTFFKTLCF